MCTLVKELRSRNIHRPWQRLKPVGIITIGWIQRSKSHVTQSNINLLIKRVVHWVYTRFSFQLRLYRGAILNHQVARLEWLIIWLNIYLHKVNNSFLANSAVCCTQQLNGCIISPTSASPRWRYSVKSNSKLWQFHDLWMLLSLPSAVSLLNQRMIAFTLLLARASDQRPSAFSMMLSLRYQRQDEGDHALKREGKWKHLRFTEPTALYRSFQLQPV